MIFRVSPFQLLIMINNINNNATFQLKLILSELKNKLFLHLEKLSYQLIIDKFIKDKELCRVSFFPSHFFIPADFE